MENKAFQRLAPLRDDDQPDRRPARDERLLDGAAAGDKLVAVTDEIRRRAGRAPVPAVLPATVAGPSGGRAGRSLAIARARPPWTRAGWTWIGPARLPAPRPTALLPRPRRRAERSLGSRAARAGRPGRERTAGGPAALVALERAPWRALIVGALAGGPLTSRAIVGLSIG
ncbi:MAG TPA: hypothetical protein VF231_00395 [Candidatus Limnocylindrales bacterium]